MSLSSGTRLGSYEILTLIGAGGMGEVYRPRKFQRTCFSVLDVTPALGRGFRPDEDRPGVDVAVLSWGLWQAQYQGDSAAVGTTVMLDRRPYTVIGVMPASFEFPRRGPVFGNRPASVWVPMAFTPAQLRERGNGVMHSVVARLKDGTSIDEARAEVASSHAGSVSGIPRLPARDRRWG